ncbi:MAG: CZB domain-containing protein [Magnetococcales bacterium]|nr:CZB domain-containing protein [Magnetococcales bacterium]
MITPPLAAPTDPWAEMGVYAALKPVQAPFPVPTFPEPELFLYPLERLDHLLRWYEILQRVLTSNREAAILSLVDDNRLIRFPATISWSRLLTCPPPPTLADNHRQLCNNVRNLLTGLGKQEKESARQAWQNSLNLLKSHMEEIHRLLPKAAFQGYKLEERKNFFVQAHLEWLGQFESYLDGVLERGATVWERIEEAGNYRRCRLGQAFSRQNGDLWPWRQLPAVQEMDRLHKHFHATVAIDAAVASSLRGRGVSPGELEQLNRFTRQKIANLQTISRQLVSQIHTTFQAVAREEGPPPAFLPPAPKPLALQEAIAGLKAWEARICAFVDSPTDTSIDRVLLHTSCPTGARIDAVMDDPFKLQRHGPVLEKIDTLHRNLHATGAIMVALVREHQLDNARRLLDNLQRYRLDLIGYLELSGDLLNIVK